MPDGTILDIYEVAHSGLDQPVKMYLDEYHTDTLKAPKGFTCAEVLRARCEIKKRVSSSTNRPTSTLT